MMIIIAITINSMTVKLRDLVASTGAKHLSCLADEVPDEEQL